MDPLVVGKVLSNDGVNGRQQLFRSIDSVVDNLTFRTKFIDVPLRWKNQRRAGSIRDPVPIPLIPTHHDWETHAVFKPDVSLDRKATHTPAHSPIFPPEVREFAPAGVPSHPKFARS